MNTKVKKKPLVRTERLEIKPLSQADIGGMVELFTHPGVYRTFMVPELGSPEEYAALTQTFIAFSSLEDTEHLFLGVYLSGRLIGFINDCGIEEDRIEVGYVIHPDENGKGYATEALRAILKELKEMGFKTVRAGHFVENPGSRRVMEKCGMHPIDLVEEGEYRGARHKCLYCEIEL